MKIAILGTKGIPNNYGGFEQFAEYISGKLVERGHSVTVYNPSFHPFEGTTFNGVTIIKKYSPEALLGSVANFVYDFLCLKDALTRDFDIIYEAGYHSVALSYRLLDVRNRDKPVIITNMDGLEYKRSKWNGPTRSLIRKLEKIAVRESPFMIADNLGIKEYYSLNFGAESFFIPYGADPVESFDETFLLPYSLKKFDYFILIARMEPENNIEAILEGHSSSLKKKPFIVVGNYKASYGNYLRKKYGNELIQFVGGIYNKTELDSLRYFSLAYFHGHSVGGTNPSLLEAMACNCFIVAHDNAFNKSVMNESALYFAGKSDIRKVMDEIQALRETHFVSFKEANATRIRTQYHWENIVSQHEDLFRKLVEQSQIETIG